MMVDIVPCSTFLLHLAVSSFMLPENNCELHGLETELNQIYNWLKLLECRIKKGLLCKYGVKIHVATDLRIIYFERKLTVIPVKLVKHSVCPLSPLLIDEAKTEPKEGKLVHHMVLQNV